MSRYVEYPPGSGVGAMYDETEWRVLTGLATSARLGEITEEQAHKEMLIYHEAKAFLHAVDADAVRERLFFDFNDFDPKNQHRRGTPWLGSIYHLSASSLGMFRRCPEQWRNRYLLGRKEPPGEGIVVGNFFHETMEFNYSQKIRTHTDRPLSEVVEFLQDEAVPRVLNQAGGASEVSWDIEDPRKALDKGRADAQRMVAVYHGNVLPRIQPFATEQRLDWFIRDVPVPIIGYLDVVAVGPEIVDTKTGKKIENRVKPGWQLQGKIYASWSGMPVAYHSISRAGKVVTPLESPELLVHPNEAEARNLAGVIRTMVRQIEWMYETLGPDQPWPTWGRYADWSMTMLPCNRCGFRAARRGYPACPAWA